MPKFSLNEEVGVRGTDSTGPFTLEPTGMYYRVEVVGYRRSADSDGCYKIWEGDLVKLIRDNVSISTVTKEKVLA